MSGPSLTAALHAQIAGLAGVPAGSLRLPRGEGAAGEALALRRILDLCADPDGRRVAAAFLALSPPFRTSLAVIAESLLARTATVPAAAAPSETSTP